MFTQHSHKQVYEQIQDDDYNTPQTNNDCNNNKNIHHQHQYHEYQQAITTTITTTNYLSNQQQHQQYHYQQQHQQKRQTQQVYQRQTNHQQNDQYKQISQNKTEQNHTINQQSLSKLQSSQINNNNEDSQGIKIAINKSQKKGGIMSYYYVYIIEGYDNKGSFSVPRRFNQFYQMRSAIVNRWPGCFVPSIPAKNALAKNDPSIIKKRTRYLNDFVKKIATLPHLYYGEQFQTLLRSQQHDVSDTFTKWPQPTSQSIINKYRVNFSQLAGKQLNFETQQKINTFHQLIKRNQSQLIKQRQSIKQLAQSHDKVIKSYAGLFGSVFLNYEKQCYGLYCNNKQDQMLYMNQSQVKLQQHQTLAKQATNQNPYWLLYDIIRHQQRDALAFNEVFQTKLKYQQKKLSIQQKIIQNEKKSNDILMNKKTTNQDIKQKLQHQLIQLQRQKQNILIIIDIISAMISYIEIERYKKEKITSYRNTINKICITQINSVQNLGQVWNGLQKATDKKIVTNNNRNNQLNLSN